MKKKKNWELKIKKENLKMEKETKEEKMIEIKLRWNLLRKKEREWGTDKRDYEYKK